MKDARGEKARNRRSTVSLAARIVNTADCERGKQHGAAKGVKALQVSRARTRCKKHTKIGNKGVLVG